MTWEGLLDWPGKSNEIGDELPAVVHMVDVAACAELLIDGHSAFLQLTGQQREAMILLVALHDIGKLSESFQSLIRDKIVGAPRHWQLSDFILLNLLDDEMSKILPSDESVRSELYAAVAGHHGQPPTRVGGQRHQKQKLRKAVGIGLEACSQWVTYLATAYPNASLRGITTEKARALSWALCGLTVVSDWVGSNSVWFPLNRRSESLHATLEESRRLAKQAIRNAGLVAPQAESIRSDFLAGLSGLRPMQHAAATVELECGPQLILLEDSTGTGKTEAAMILARRMILAGKARGLFFALPTMATSDAMYERMQAILPDMFEVVPPSMLIHGQAKLFDAIQTVRGASVDTTPETEQADWLSDGRRRALLAAVCIGTIDQAILGILPTKFSALRLFGLSDKLLIVDEAHSYDPYMQNELECLLEMHAMLGGSAIVMTATLPLSMQKSYAESFQRGLSVEPSEVDGAHYPGIYIVGNRIKGAPVEPFRDSIRSVKVKRLNSTREAECKLIEVANDGAATVWVRNSVDEAIKTAAALQQQNIEPILLHARFTMSDRLKIERSVKQLFGKNGCGRKGRVLIATQVVEASLDLDFDAMFTDLAPIGSLVQRAGRLWRHTDIRPSRDRPLAGPTLFVISPDPNSVDGKDWLSNVIGGGAWVYRLDEQWLTARAAFGVGQIDSPDGLRAMIEAVHGDVEYELPQPVLAERNQSIGKMYAQRAVAQGNVVEPSRGYILGCGGAVSNDAVFPTRLGEKHITIVLTRRSIEGLKPWARHNIEEIAWALSEVTASRRQFEDLLPMPYTDEVRELIGCWPVWKQDACKQGTYFVGVVEDGTGLIGERLIYDGIFGLRPFSPSSEG